MKNKKIKLGLIAGGISGVMAIQGCDVQTVNKTAMDNPTVDNPTVDNPNTDSVKLEERLIELSQPIYLIEPAYPIEPEPAFPMGAMCYEPAMPAYIDYICSYCGDTIKEKYYEWKINEIAQIEEIVKQIKENGYDVVLDKTEFCPHCSKQGIESPELIFKIRFSNNADYHIAKSNIVYEYRCLLAFLSNKETYSGSNRDIIIIQKMTGLGEDLKIEENEK